MAYTRIHSNNHTSRKYLLNLLLKIVNSQTKIQHMKIHKYTCILLYMHITTKDKLYTTQYLFNVSLKYSQHHRVINFNSEISPMTLLVTIL